MKVYADCTTCHGTGKIMGGGEYHDCPGCRLTARAEDRQRAIAEDSIEALYKGAGFEDMDPLTQWAADGHR